MYVLSIILDKTRPYLNNNNDNNRGLFIIGIGASASSSAMNARYNRIITCTKEIIS